MTFPVKVYGRNGKLKKIITSEMLEKRADADLHRANAVPREVECGVCGTVFWTAIKGRKYCHDDCTRKAYTLGQARRGRERRAQLKKEIPEIRRLRRTRTEPCRSRPKNI